MLRPIPMLMSLVAFGTICAQEPPPLTMPHVGGERFGAKQETAAVADPISSYRNRREAALAAFQAGYKASVVERKRERAIRLLLVALRRDPQLAPALFDMAVLCAQENRWRDSMSFLREAQKQATADSEIARLAATELARVEAIERLESTPEGKKQRQFDIEFMAALKREKDTFAALDELKQLAKRDSTRWEAPALAGVIQAGIGGSDAFAESAADLENAARLADKSRAAHLKSAAEVAHGESVYLYDVGRADGLSEQQKHAPAAELYAKAWQESQGHWDTALESVTEYLMADQTDPATGLLSLMRDSGPPALRAKALAMLKELAAVSTDAKRAAERDQSPEAAQPVDPGTRIRNLVGSLTNPQMELAASPEPALLDDRTPIVPVPDDEIGGGSSDLMLLSTDSIFALYQRNLGGAAAPAGAAPEQAPQETPAEPAREAQPAPIPVVPRAREGLRPSPFGASSSSLPARPSKGAEQTMTIRSNPPGAAVLLDDTVNCVAPCQAPLAPGRHTLHATLAGYRDAYRIFSVERDKAASAIEVSLDAKRGWLNVESEIPGAPVFLDGHNTGKRTPARFTLNEGTYEVGVDIDGRRSAQKITITDSDVVRLKF